MDEGGEHKTQCVIYREVLSNDAIKPSKLKRHLAKHKNLAVKPQEFFERKRDNPRMRYLI